ncbi:hypothetical protein DNU06_06725 [Putridiphycobacter roseus]|uniref:Uncharacterized protein n=1 Tax=Putridiphycobacter roseus TaxID=2219161 RepID=A0A2W1NHW6_9FLAO|nr:hypothetical protein [Putridiphycobacter roseus]PZE17516.1 hypothetical protein DNU06_06725 [Putridiphycobacter roseus]
MEILVKQITKEIEDKQKIFFLDENDQEYQIDWAQPRFENIGFQLKEDSQFNNKSFAYKGKCKLLAVGKGKEFEERHIFLNRQTKHRFYINEAEFEANFEPKVKA